MQRIPTTIATLGLACLLAAACSSKPKYPTCSSEKDCKEGEKCIDRKCVQCGSDEDCGPGMECKANACVKKEGWCAGDGDCDNGQVCKNNQCVACQADIECGEGGKCIDGGCLRKGQCRTDEDCPEDEDCVKGVCTKAGAAEGALPDCKLEPIYFAYDQYAIPDESKPLLQSNADCLTKAPRGVAVLGYTDNRGTDEYNIGLSDDRAQAVITYLARLGIDPSRLRKVPKGEAEAVGTDEASFAKDRRVELKWE
jgi:peptidoglycan-associated lipoprotein